MAKQLYDYWFVQFDFPNEEGKPYKSSGGKMVWNDKLKREIPEGWNVVNLIDFAEIKNGATPSTATPLNYGGDIIWITPKDLSDQQSKFVYQGERNISQLGYNSCSTNLLPANSVLLSSRAPIGLVSITKAKLCTNQGFKNLVPHDAKNSLYLYYYIKHHIKQIEQLGTGTTFKEVSREDLCKFPILMPCNTLGYLVWVERMTQIADEQFALTKEIATLTKQRDELLPLLMNGQASVNYHLANKNNVVNTLFSVKLLTLYKIGLNMSENLKLWDIIDSFISGDWGNEEESPEAPCCVSCIRGADIVSICNSDFENIPIRYISNRSFTTHCLQEGDIIVEKSGGSPTQSTGRVVYISKELLATKHDIVCSNFCVAFRVKPEWNSLYIYYYLRNVYNAGVFFNFEGKTSGIKNLDIETAFKAIPVKTIAMETQISIATAISCLDKKIALNRAINDNLPTLDHSSVVVKTRLAA